VASYQRNLAAALAEFAAVRTVRLPTDRVLGADLAAVRRRRARYLRLADASGEADAALIDYTDSFWNGSRVGECFFPAFARRLTVPAVVILHERPGRTDPADAPGPRAVRGLYRLAHRAFAAWDTRSLRYEPFVRSRLFDFAAHLVTHSPTLAGPRVAVLPTPAYPLPAPAWTRAEVDGRFRLAGKRVAVLLGFPQPSKGFDRAIAALPYLPPDVTLVQCGWSERSEPEGLKLVSQAASLGVGERFIRTGYLSDAELAAVLARADVALAPFRSVHQSSSLGHLIAAGLPVVAGRIPAVERLAADGAGVAFADCDDPAGFAAAAMDGMADPELRAKNTAYTVVHGFREIARQLVGRAAGVAS
jgi:glycosyltransferase involved in cell wall biosynthesis